MDGVRNQRHTATAVREAGEERTQTPGGAKKTQGKALLVQDPEPWPEPVDLDLVLTELASVIKRYVAISEEAAVAVALWIIFTYAIDAAYIAPLLAICSPEKRCGKTTLLQTLQAAVRRPLLVSNITSAGLFRIVEEFEPTLLIDEADTFLGAKEELHGIINSGHARNTAQVIRVAGDNHEPRIYSTWCPKAIAKIGRLPGTLEDRSVVIPMRRALPGERVEPFRADRIWEELEPICRKARRWALDNLDRLRRTDPELPEELHHRAQDNWRILVAIADLAGGEWPERARRAARILSGGYDEADTSLSLQLLADLRDLFGKWREDKIPSQTIVDRLIRLPDRPWSDLGYGKCLTQRKLADLLSRYTTRDGMPLKPKDIWIGGTNGRSCKGYVVADFEDAFSRYLPDQGRGGRESSKHATKTDDENCERDGDLALVSGGVSRCTTLDLARLADCVDGCAP